MTSSILDSAEPVALIFLWVVMGGVMLAVLGILLSPMAGTICSLIARVKRYRLPYVSFWITGAWYSMLFVAPWFYLVFRMLGLRIPDIFVRTWYGIFFTYWSLGVLVLFGAGVQQFVVEKRTVDALVLGLVAVFLAVVEFVVIRRLIRRHVAYADDHSPVMRRVYVLLQVLWIAGSVCLVLVGLRELQQFDKLSAAIPLMVLAGLLLVAGLIVRSRVQLRDIDSLDFPATLRSEAILPDSIYLEPFSLVLKMFALALVVTIAVWFFGLFLWASGAGS